MSDLDLKEWAQAISFTTPRKCECGLEKTYGPDTNLEHSEYCPKYKEHKERK